MSYYIEDSFHSLDRKATNQLDTLMEYVWREWIRNRTKTGPEIIKLFEYDLVLQVVLVFSVSRL